MGNRRSAIYEKKTEINVSPQSIQDDCDLKPLHGMSFWHLQLVKIQSTTGVLLNIVISLYLIIL